MAATKSKTGKVKEKEQLDLSIDLQNKWIQRLKWILFGLAFLVYMNGLNNGYNMDDYLVTKDHQLTSQGISSVKQIFTSPYYSDANGYSYGYRPIVHLSFAIEHDIFGQNPQAGHFINLLLFGFSVFFLFKLLNLLFGKENYLYTFLACALFAIHPIHTEVVNSLKNRDELLSFFFAVLAGIQLIKYVQKKDIISFLLATLLFLVAILSKKSVYPMVIIIPATLYLIQNISFKHLLYITFALSVPAAIFGSEMQINRMILLGIFPTIVLLIIYAIKHWKEQIPFLQKAIIILPVTFIAGITYYSIINWNYPFLFLLIPLIYWLFHLNYRIGTWITSIITAAIAIRFEISEFYLLSMLFTSGVAAYYWFYKKEKKIDFLILAVLSIIVAIVFNHKLMIIALPINYIVFFWIASKQKKRNTIIYTAITSIAVFTFLILFNKNDVFLSTGAAYAYILIATTIFSIIKKDFIQNHFSQWNIVAMLVIILSLANYSSYLYNKENPVQITTTFETPTQEDIVDPVTLAHKTRKTTPNFSKNIFQEGRDLEYVENPLVAQHSKEETIATGFYTLGHYARLMLYPKELSYYYGFAKIETMNLKSTWVWISIIFHLGLIFLTLYYFKRNWFITIGFAWYLACILLFSNWVELVAGIVGERLAYLASAGFLIGVAGIAKEIKLLNRKKEVYLIPLSIIGLLLAGRTWTRNSDWKSDYILMKHDIPHLQNSAQANNLYASVLMRMGTENPNLNEQEKIIFFTAGAKHFKQATKIDPLFFNATFDLGRASMYIADTSQAMDAFERCTVLAPDFEDAKLKLSYLKLFYSQYQGEDKMDYQIYWDSLQKAQNN